MPKEILYHGHPSETPLIHEHESTFPKCLNYYRAKYGPLHFYGNREHTPEGRGDYMWYSYSDVCRMVAELSHGLIELNLEPPKNPDPAIPAKRPTIGIFSANRVEWNIADAAIVSSGAITVPFYDVQSAHELLYIANLVEVSAIFVSAKCLPKLADIYQDIPSLKHIILFDDEAPEREFLYTNFPEKCPEKISTKMRRIETFDKKFEDWKEKLNFCEDVENFEISENFSEIFDFCENFGFDFNIEESDQIFTETFSKLRENGRKHVPIDQAPFIPQDTCTGDEIATIVFTSGSTGMPKGAMLTHRNVLYAAKALGCRASRFPGEFDWPHVPQDTFLSYLPSAHIFARALGARSWFVCEHTGFFSGSIATLFDDFKALKPTMLPAVPRVLQKIYDSVDEKLKKMGKIKKFLFEKNLEKKIKKVKKHDFADDYLDKIFFNQIKETLGGNIRLIYTGSAPLAASVATFIQATLCPYIVEGYGSTECSACAAVQPYGTTVFGNIGYPIGEVQAKIIPVESLGYNADPNDEEPSGELLLKGPGNMRGYYLNPEATAESIDEDGWLHTGDVVKFRSDKFIYIIDRVKNIVKLSQGEWVSLEAISTSIKARCSAVAQIAIVADSNYPYLIAIAVPEASKVLEIFSKLSKNKEHFTSQDLQRIIKEKKVIEYFLQEIRGAGKAANLRSFELPKAIILDANCWSSDNNLATPSMKLKLNNIKKYYADRTAKIYEKFAESDLMKKREFETEKISEILSQIN